MKSCSRRTSRAGGPGKRKRGGGRQYAFSKAPRSPQPPPGRAPGMASAPTGDTASQTSGTRAPATRQGGEGARCWAAPSAPADGAGSRTSRSRSVLSPGPHHSAPPPPTPATPDPGPQRSAELEPDATVTAATSVHTHLRPPLRSGGWDRPQCGSLGRRALPAAGEGRGVRAAAARGRGRRGGAARWVF